jgi:hypothetical protein
MVGKKGCRGPLCDIGASAEQAAWKCANKVQPSSSRLRIEEQVREWAPWHVNFMPKFCDHFVSIL